MIRVELQSVSLQHALYATLIPPFLPNHLGAILYSSLEYFPTTLIYIADRPVKLTIFLRARGLAHLLSNSPYANSPHRVYTCLKYDPDRQALAAGVVVDEAATAPDLLGGQHVRRMAI